MLCMSWLCCVVLCLMCCVMLCCAAGRLDLRFLCVVVVTCAVNYFFLERMVNEVFFAMVAKIIS